MDTGTASSVGDLATLIRSFPAMIRAPRAPRPSPPIRRRRTSSLAFLRSSGMPTEVAKINRDHVEAFVEQLVATRWPATANNR